MASLARSTQLSKPDLSEVIDKIGMGLAQVRFIVSGGGVWFADGLELSMISSIAVAVALTFNVGPAARGLLVTIVYLGVMFGNLLCGPVGDRYGRRFCIIVSYLSIFVFSVLSSFAPTYWSLLAIRFIVGVSFGFGQPIWTTLASEISPNQWRIFVQAVSQSLFTVGEVYCYILVYFDNPWMENLDWRVLLRQGAVPSLIFFLVAFFWLLQSPYFLAVNGRKAEAQEVLEVMRCDNCAPELALDFMDIVQTDASERSEFQAIFSSSLIRTTLIVSYTCFVLNFFFYGALYAFPNVLPLISNTAPSSMTPAMDCIIGALWEFPGYALAVVFCKFTPYRKPVIKGYLLICGLCMLLFVAGFYMHVEAIWHIGFWGLKAFDCMGYVVVYVYMAEVYPTKLRTTGCAVSMAAGRIGAMIAPLAYELLTSWTGTFVTYFFVNVVICITNMPLIDLLEAETANVSLSAKDSIPDFSKSYGSMGDSMPPSVGDLRPSSEQSLEEGAGA